MQGSADTKGADAAQANTTGVCNAWIYCGNAGGCHNITENYGAGFNMCSLYYASDLDYNVPLDKNVGVARAPNVTFTSGGFVLAYDISKQVPQHYQKPLKQA